MNNSKLSMYDITSFEEAMNHAKSKYVFDDKIIAQNYFESKNYINLAVCFIYDKPRNLASNLFEIKKIDYDTNLKSQREKQTSKDIYMTNHTDYSSVIWDGKSKGSYANTKRAIENNKKLKVHYIPLNRCFVKEELTVKNIDSIYKTNLYGPNDNFDLETSHVLPALLRKMHEAKVNNEPQVEIWGSGKPRREFLYSEDMADACVFLLETRDFTDVIGTDVLTSAENCKQALTSVASKEIRNTHINIGTGVDISIKELAETIKKIVGYRGELTFNDTKPDGTMLKLTDPSKLHSLGWKHTVELHDGIKIMHEWYLSKKQGINL
ncbi:NAD-dependent epimerase/dehydratase family protein [bacterium]|nr:NAD-dependent epimerase/dehydratase family protein [bacterium]MBU1993812.1 NAD-dependent epimerase/dehydratase family protein [bacterium]